jgi:hypothetical protein
VRQTVACWASVARGVVGQPKRPRVSRTSDGQAGSSGRRGDDVSAGQRLSLLGWSLRSVKPPHF